MHIQSIHDGKKSNKTTLFPIIYIIWKNILHNPFHIELTEWSHFTLLYDNVCMYNTNTVYKYFTTFCSHSILFRESMRIERKNKSERERERTNWATGITGRPYKATHATHIHPRSSLHSQATSGSAKHDNRGTAKTYIVSMVSIIEVNSI